MDRFRSTWWGLGRKENDEGNKSNGNPIAILTSSTVGSIIRNNKSKLQKCRVSYPVPVLCLEWSILYKKSEKWNRWVVRCRQFICQFWMNHWTCWFTKWKNMLRCLIKLQVLTAGQIGQEMTGTLSSNCRRIYFAAQEFSNCVTEHNSDITSVRYILFYDERIGAGVAGKITAFTRLYTTAELERLYRRISSSPKFPVQPKSKRIIVAWSRLRKESISQNFYCCSIAAASIDLEIHGILFNIIISNRRRVTYSALRRPNTGSRTLCFRRKDLDVGCHRF